MHQPHGRNHLYYIYTICSSERYLNEEIKYIQSTFEKVNNYPNYVITQLKREVKLKHTQNMNIEEQRTTQEKHADVL